MFLPAGFQRVVPLVGCDTSSQQHVFNGGPGIEFSEVQRTLAQVEGAVHLPGKPQPPGVPRHGE